MSSKLSEILDECITRISEGETIESCLAEYPGMREQIEPLLSTAQFISTVPRVSPSEEYIRTSEANLKARLSDETIQAQPMRYSESIPLLESLGLLWQRLWQATANMRKTAIPITLAVLLAHGAGLAALNVLSPPMALASGCTLSILSGSVEVQEAGRVRWQQGNDGMSLVAGTRVRTAEDSHALLTFFEGSTIKLEPNSNVEIKQIEYAEGESIRIVLKQWLGRTWSRVVKMADPGSHYEIETPSATALVRGTLFSTEVNETGTTKVATTEGLVSVVAKGEEVYLPASQQSTVVAGRPPSQPQTTYTGDTELIITVDMPGAGSVCDPTGSSTGILPTGLSFNQILGSQASLLSDGTQQISVSQPVTGDYLIALRNATGGTGSYRIEGKSGGKLVFEHTGTFEASEEEGGSLIHFNLQVEDGLIVNGEVGDVEPLGDKQPEKIIDTEPPNDKGERLGSPTRTQDKKQKPVNDQSESNKQKPVNDQSKGNKQKPVNDQSEGSKQKQINEQTQDNKQKSENTQGQGKVRSLGDRITKKIMDIKWSIEQGQGRKQGHVNERDKGEKKNQGDNMGQDIVNDEDDSQDQDTVHDDDDSQDQDTVQDEDDSQDQDIFHDEDDNQDQDTVHVDDDNQDQDIVHDDDDSQDQDIIQDEDDDDQGQDEDQN